jgi:hypothetical protein
MIPRDLNVPDFVKELVLLSTLRGGVTVIMHD